MLLLTEILSLLASAISFTWPNRRAESDFTETLRALALGAGLLELSSTKAPARGWLYAQPEVPNHPRNL